MILPTPSSQGTPGRADAGSQPGPASAAPILLEVCVISPEEARDSLEIVEAMYRERWGW